MSMTTNKQALLQRIEKALNDFTNGRASMHVPPLDTDVDMVLAECATALEAAERYGKDRDSENEDLMLTVGRLRVEREASEAEIDEKLCKLLPGCQYMDPPDGGSVMPLEQVSRMVADYRERMEAAERRIAELEARAIDIKRQAQALFEAIANPSDHYVPAYVRCLREALIGNSAATDKGE